MRLSRLDGGFSAGGGWLSTEDWVANYFVCFFLQLLGSLHEYLTQRLPKDKEAESGVSPSDKRRNIQSSDKARQSCEAK